MPPTFALVLANANYRDRPLKRTTAVATELRRQLSATGGALRLFGGNDLSSEDARREIRCFCASLREAVEAVTVVIVLAGHGGLERFCGVETSDVDCNTGLAPSHVELTPELFAPLRDALQDSRFEHQGLILLETCRHAKKADREAIQQTRQRALTRQRSAPVLRQLRPAATAANFGRAIDEQLLHAWLRDMPVVWHVAFASVSLATARDGVFLQSVVDGLKVQPAQRLRVVLKRAAEYVSRGTLGKQTPNVLVYPQQKARLSEWYDGRLL